SRMRRYAPQAAVSVAPHEAPALFRPQRTEVFTPTRGAGERLRVAALGIFAEHKGGRFLLDCIAASVERGLAIDWIVLGEFQGELRERAKRFQSVLTVTGRYKEADLQRLIGAHNPHLIFFPQHVPETYSFTLSEAFGAARPILAPDLGSFPERVA